MWEGYVQIILLLLMVNLFPTVIIVSVRSGCCIILGITKNLHLSCELFATLTPQVLFMFMIYIEAHLLLWV